MTELVKLINYNRLRLIPQKSADVRETKYHRWIIYRTRIVPQMTVNSSDLVK